MSGRNFIVTPRSWTGIEQSALEWRDSFVRDDPYTPVMELVEKVFCNKLRLFNFEVRSNAEMGGAEGYTYPDGSAIVLREDVYHGAARGNPRDRFTVAHEFGHWVLHTNQPLARASSDRTVPAYCLSEPQANQFASEFLMPRKFFGIYDDTDDVMNRHQVSFQAASARLNYLRKRELI